MTADANRRGILSTFLLSLLCVLGLGVRPAPSAPAPRAPAPRNTPRGLKDATLLGHEDGGRPIAVILTLDLRDRASADALIAAQQDPSSPQYHVWITPEEFQGRFGPLPEDLQAAADFLEAHGFTGVSRPASTMVRGEGTVALAERAFQVTINRYQYHGRQVFANTSDPVLPPGLAKKVARVAGLDSMTRMFPHIAAKAQVSPDYLLSGTNYMLARDTQVAYEQKSAYFDAGKRGVPGRSWRSPRRSTSTSPR